ncbi:MAG: extracellular solute-binding protein, partial [Chloroflexi bacterium]|nr:extracellular solute-binding protein [Chloroflexota bacterium]
MKRIYGIFSIVLILTFVLSACGAQPTATPAPKPTEKPAAPAATQAPAATKAPAATTAPAAAAAGLKGAVTLWHAYGTGSTEEKALTQVLDGLKKENPDLKLTVLQIPFDQVFNKWETEVAAGGGPDMFTAPNDNLGNEVRAKVVAPVDDLMKDNLSLFSPAGVSGLTVDGKLYGVPGIIKAVALYYNK